MDGLLVSPAGLSLIKHFEGFSPKIYICPAGYPTIGYGHVVLTWQRSAYQSREISEDEATALLRADVAIAERSVGSLITAPLTQGQFDALVSFTFNLGGGALQSSTLRRKVNRKEYDAAAKEFSKWVFGGRPPRRLRGLIERRSAEAGMFSGIIYNFT